jgi:hypothetical protein
MNILKIGCSILLIALTGLLPANFGYALDPGGGDVLVTQVSANEMYGYLPKEKLSFLIQSGWDIYAGPTENGETYGKRMTKIEFYLGEKTLLVQAGPSELYIKGVDTGTGALMRLTTGEKNLLRNALENTGKIKLGEHTDLFLSSLEALASWPRNMLVFVWHDDAQAMSAVGADRLATMSRKDFNARNVNAVKVVPLDRPTIESLTPPVLNLTATDVRQTESVLAVTSICFALGKRIRGRYFECDDPICVGRTSHRFLHVVGGRTCFGRCGTRCSGTPHGAKYTKDCFNHDGCVQHLGIDAESCLIMFTFCVDDAIRAPRCPR